MKKNAEGSKEIIMRKDQIARPIEGQECQKKAHLEWKVSFVA